MMKSILLVVLISSTAQCSLAQTDDTEHWHQHYLDYGKQYRDRVPSFECDESMALQQFKNGKAKWTVRLDATLREIRAESPAGEFTDHYEFKSLNGKPPKPNFRVPYFINGAFSNAFGSSKSVNEACLSHHIASTPGDSTIRLLSDLTPVIDPANCLDPPTSFHRVVIFDRATGAVIHIQRTISLDWSQSHNIVPESSIDFAPQSFGDLVVWLPIRFEVTDPVHQGRETATFSNFHRYIGDARILPDTATPVVDPNNSPH